MEDKLKVNLYGQAILSGDHLRELLLQGKNISHLNVTFDEEIKLFQKYQEEVLNETVTFLDEPEEVLSFDEFHQNCADTWIFPVAYQEIDVKSWLLDKCNTQQEKDRVIDECQLYEERDLIMLLRLFIYIIDYFRKNNYVWGVGRGSSTNSYILFLIGTHFVDSIKYGLEVRDFLK